MKLEIKVDLGLVILALALVFIALHGWEITHKGTVQAEGTFKATIIEPESKADGE